MTIDEKNEDRVKGMLWGLLVGNAFGCPLQYRERDKQPWVTEMEPSPDVFEDFVVPAGCWTEDGSLALCIMDSLVRKGAYDMADVGQTFVRWFREGYLSSVEGRVFPLDAAVRTSLVSLERKLASLEGETRKPLVEWRQTLSNGREECQGNGPLAHLAPCYLIGRMTDCFECTPEVSSMTHNAQMVRDMCAEMKEILTEHLKGTRTTRAFGAELPRARVPNAGWCVDTLTTAIWAFRTTETFEDGLVSAANLGGDADSIGAVYGQIAGAYYGLKAIPERWIRAMKTPDELARRIDAFIVALHEADRKVHGKKR